MQRELQRVVALQPSWSSRRSPAMDERGLLVRRGIPAWLASHRTAVAAAVGIPLEDLLVEGRDGTGLKTRVPWARFSSRTRSPSATNGFYVVLLFDARGEAVYLSLNQGTTDFEGGDYRRKPERVLRARSQWARDVVAGWLAGRQDLTRLELHDRPASLGEGYELGDVASVRYADGAVPDDAALLADVLSFAEALGAIYDAQGRMPLPFESPELEYAIAATAEAAGRRSKGAGFSTNPTEIHVVERHAVDLALDHYTRLGWSATHVGDRGNPYDLDVRRPGRRLYVEVKGTTSDGMIVTLTDGEVRHHERVHPDNALVVVSRIVLDRSVSPPRATGGELREIRPWRIDPAHLRPIAHRYAVPDDA